MPFPDGEEFLTSSIALSASDRTFAARNLTAITAACRTQLSLKASMDVADSGRQIALIHSKLMAAAIDSVGFIVTGTGQPRGIHSIIGRGTVSGVGLPADWENVLDGVKVFLNANNAIADLTGIVMHHDIWRIYAGLKTGISSDKTSLELPPSTANTSQFVSTGADIVSSPESYHVTTGNCSDLPLGFRLDPSVWILDSTTSYASNLLIEIVGVMRVDVVALWLA